MSPRRWTEFASSKPLPVTGGVVARSARGSIGEQWWSRRFVAVLESFALGTRLTRGRAYARRGQVVSLEIRPGAVEAVVQGSRPAPYRVVVGLQPFAELVWAKVEVVLAEEALHSAQLLAGEFPPELEDVFASMGAPLFPQRQADLAMSCSCPDFAVPCKHLAATLYLLAERFDDDPFEILHWRGRDRAALLDRLRQLRGGTVGERSSVEPVRVVGAAMALHDVAGPVVSDIPEVWASEFFAGGDLDPIPATAVVPTDLLLRQLPAPPAALGGQSLVTWLVGLYAALGARGDASLE